MSTVTRDVPALDTVCQMRPEISGNHPLDDAVLEALPSKLKVISANCYGTSAWSTTASIHTKDNDGQILRFFIKYASGEHGKAQIEGEFRSMQEIYQTMPNFAPQPCSFGQAKTASLPTYFFICEFVNISDELPDPRLLGARLAQLHKQSQSPTGKFGFYCPTYDGKLPQETDWDDSWVSFFTKLLKGVAELDAGVNGRWNELDEILQATTETVIPRLLGPLERDGRRIKPCLIHGDLWEGNIGTDIETGELYVFDAASYYGHNEMELGIWRTDHHRMNGSSYKREYERNFRASEPIEEWDDRNRLYCVKTQLMYSAHIPGTNVRNAAMENLEFLNDKYGRCIESVQTNEVSHPSETEFDSDKPRDVAKNLDSLESHLVGIVPPVATTIEV